MGWWGKHLAAIWGLVSATPVFWVVHNMPQAFTSFLTSAGKKRELCVVTVHKGSHRKTVRV